jgi:hypothetical protein
VHEKAYLLRTHSSFVCTLLHVVNGSGTFIYATVGLGCFSFKFNFIVINGFHSKLCSCLCHAGVLNCKDLRVFFCPAALPLPFLNLLFIRLSVLFFVLFFSFCDVCLSGYVSFVHEFPLWFSLTLCIFIFLNILQVQCFLFLLPIIIVFCLEFLCARDYYLNFLSICGFVVADLKICNRAWSLSDI